MLCITLRDLCCESNLYIRLCQLRNLIILRRLLMRLRVGIINNMILATQVFVPLVQLEQDVHSVRPTFLLDMQVTSRVRWQHNMQFDIYIWQGKTLWSDWISKCWSAMGNLQLLSKVQFTSRTFEILSALKSIKGFPPPPRSHMILFPRCVCAARDVSITEGNVRGNYQQTD